LTDIWRREIEELTTSPSRATQPPDRMFVTIRAPMSISGMVLLPGRYAFRPLDSGIPCSPIQIFNEDEARLVATVPWMSVN
jgi:hypothetical protein